MVSLLITSNSFYNKSLDILQSNPSIDSTIFQQITEESFSSNIDQLCLLLLEHLPLEIQLNLLTSTTKLYRPKLISFVQHASESEKVLHRLYEYFQVKNLEELLLIKQNSQPIYWQCLQHLKPLLTKTTYDKYPLAIQVFVHIVHSLRQATLSELIDFVFPVCLMTLDDPSIEMKLISLHLFDHLQRNSTTTDLLLFNRANVVMYGLEQNLSRRADRLIFFECLLVTTFHWLIIIENEVYSGKHLFIRTSQFIERFIRDCLLETNINYRGLLLRILRLYINRLQLFASRHFSHLLELINDSIDHRLLRSDSLELFLTILQVLKPRVHVHRYDLMKIIIRCLFQIIHDEKSNTSIINLLEKCLKELHRLTSENYVPDALKSLIDTPQLDSTYREYLQQYLDTLKKD